MTYVAPRQLQSFSSNTLTSKPGRQRRAQITSKKERSGRLHNAYMRWALLPKFAKFMLQIPMSRQPNPAWLLKTCGATV
eukprot:2516577-Amphidinium_carterae.1